APTTATTRAFAYACRTTANVELGGKVRKRIASTSPAPAAVVTAPERASPMMRSTVATSRCANRTVSHTAVEKLREVGHHPASRITRDLYIPEAVISSSLKVLASQSFHTSKYPLQRALSTHLTSEHGKFFFGKKYTKKDS